MSHRIFHFRLIFTYFVRSNLASSLCSMVHRDCQGEGGGDGGGRGAVMASDWKTKNIKDKIAERIG